MDETTDIGHKLKEARRKKHWTQEKIAGLLHISRQTVSNWENNKSYPDIISLIKLSDIYQVSLDNLLKEDSSMIKHLSQSTDTVASNQKLLVAISINIGLLLLFVIFNSIITENIYLIVGCALLGLTSTVFLFFQIINRI